MCKICFAAGEKRQGGLFLSIIYHSASAFFENIEIY